MRDVGFCRGDREQNLTDVGVFKDEFQLWATWKLAVQDVGDELEELVTSTSVADGFFGYFGCGTAEDWFCELSRHGV